MPPPNNRKAIWYHPRDNKGDRLLSYIVDSNQTGNNQQIPLEPHPLASSDPNYEGLVFLFRQPAGPNGVMAQDWYGPLVLVDDLLRVSTAGAAYQSSLLYARGSEPPTGDPRLELKGQKQGEYVFNWTWAIDPDTSLPGPNVVDLTVAVGPDFTGDEVYLDFLNIGALPEVEAGLFKIARHISPTVVQIEVPYDAAALPFEQVTAIAYEGCFLLDGYSDNESAPGILADKFHVRSFNYRLALPTYTPQWDDSLGLELTQESRLVPASWARLWLPGRPPASTSDEDSSITYQSVSKTIVNRVRNVVGLNPQEDGTEWGSLMRIRVPTILKSIDVPWVWALARSDDGETESYDEDMGMVQETWGPGELTASTRTVRRVVKTNDVTQVINDQILEWTTDAGPTLSSGLLFTFQPETYGFSTGSWQAHSGDNIWTRAKVRTFSMGPFLLKNDSVTFLIPGGGRANSGGNTSVDAEGNFTFSTSRATPWGQNVLWSVSPTKARWGYWIIDFVIVTLPGSPA